ncbi:phosphate ABC transporter substrate-binding protein, PhoT family [Abditibacterium utsteinense]|uniref:Phosphate-binding protein n=1 Tax=Abditibacterium utsteinense TaxID=1960156 RepID=A0A2S8SRN3_9BACT|nr:phosphate ABC transporter substrate-binding protein PstS [Abditibacterium utsteinense]PQV63438.1 phosphate ABC transporter substrate-binding protein, PhoT family [Abditibacterium utsteinense]
MKNFWHLSAAGLALTFAGTLAGCAGNTASTGNGAGGNSAATTSTDGAAPAAGGATSLTGAGATFPAPLYTRWFDAYDKAAGVQINYQSVGSGAGIKQLASKTVDFGASDAPLGSKDIASLSAPVATIPTVGGAVVLAYNLPGAPANLKMTGSAVADIFLGKIKKWNDPAIASINPGATLPGTSIVVAHRSDGSGTTNIFTNYLAAVSPEWKTKVGAGKSVDWPTGVGGKGNDGVAAAIKQAPGGFGYVELAYAKQNKLPYASVKNLAGQFVSPDVAGVTAAAEGAMSAVEKDITAPIANAAGAKAYPISGFTYIMVYKTAQNPAKGQAVKAFLKWAMTEGQKDAAAQDYAPLPGAIVALNEKTIDALK